MHKFDVIIIGSGLGGLLCGYILAKEGLKVCILEKHHSPGGNLQNFTRQGHKFETGIHYIGGLNPGQTLHRYWKYFGLTDTLSLKKLDQDGFDRIGFGDLEYPLAQGFENFTSQLSPYFPQSKHTLDNYILTLNEIVSAFPLYNLNNLNNLYNLEQPGNHYGTHYTTQSAFDFYQNFSSGIQYPVSNVHLSSVLAGNNFLYAGNRAAPLHLATLINHSFISGAFRVIGGSDQISKILVENITVQGGTVLTGHEAISIDHINKQFLVGTINKEQYLSTSLISAIHPRTTLSMLPEKMVRPAYRERISRLDDTASSFILYLVVKSGSFPYLNYNYYHHETGDVWSESDDANPSWPAMYMLSTACHSQDQRFADTVTILTYMNFGEVRKWENTITGQRGKEYIGFKEEKAAKLLQLVEKKYPGIRSAISHMESSTPLTWRDFTGTPGGSMYGIRKDWRDPLLTTILPKTKIPGLYFTGQNINLHGALGVTIGSVMTCGEILGLEYLVKKIKDA
ncbi:MAG: NAD(P)-binding protein [Bacteroidales bacterium]|jgi:all-trans-retinol 13,14-reductase|nr:NAD(P)-binding protein [Bacteroidales bacterium]